MQISAILILLLSPLLSALFLLSGQRRLSSSLVGAVGILSSSVTLCAVGILIMLSINSTVTWVWGVPWFQVGSYTVYFNLELSPLNITMLVIVSLVSLLVSIYSSSYMKNDKRVSTFFAYVNLFVFSMLGLVMSGNLLQIYLFWELVGACSFLLIGFWYFKPSAKSAAKKAFIVTRFGDVAFLVAIFLLFWQVNSFDLSVIRTSINSIDTTTLTLIGLLIFLGAMGKSGQFPLHVWLPDAMEGPTPISALIHAATMVAAGVYLVATFFFLFQTIPMALDVIAIIGGLTAIFAAVIGCVQNDLKRILAYSTISQLGYMMLSLGSLGYVASIFHLVTHAFFKALLFLAAGVIIYIMHHEQDIRKMGGLWSKYRWLGIVFLIGCFANAGIPPTAGFFSKDDILMATYVRGNYWLLSAAIVAAGCTSYYMFRIFLNVFLGSPKTGIPQVRISNYLKTPVVILAVLTVSVGIINYPYHFFTFWLTGTSDGSIVKLVIMLLSLLFSLAGATLSYFVWSRPQTNKEFWLYKLFERKFFIDEFYNNVVARSLWGLGKILGLVERYLVDGIVSINSWLIQSTSSVGVRIQNGQLQTYILCSLMGTIFLALVILVAGRFF